MILSKYEKQPAERKDYGIPYSEWLAQTGDTLDNTVVEVVCLTDPDDHQLQVAPMTAPKDVVLWVSGGTDGQRYKVTVRVITVGGRIDENELIFTIKEY